MATAKEKRIRAEAEQRRAQAQRGAEVRAAKSRTEAAAKAKTKAAAELERHKQGEKGRVRPGEGRLPQKPGGGSGRFGFQTQATYKKNLEASRQKELTKMIADRKAASRAFIPPSARKEGGVRPSELGLSATEIRNKREMDRRRTSLGREGVRRDAAKAAKVKAAKKTFSDIAGGVRRGVAAASDIAGGVGRGVAAAREGAGQAYQKAVDVAGRVKGGIKRTAKAAASESAHQERLKQHQKDIKKSGLRTMESENFKEAGEIAKVKPSKPTTSVGKTEKPAEKPAEKEAKGYGTQAWRESRDKRRAIRKKRLGMSRRELLQAPGASRTQVQRGRQLTERVRRAAAKGEARRGRIAARKAIRAGVGGEVAETRELQPRRRRRR